MAFFQAAPRIGNQYDDDALLREYLSRRLPPPMLARIEPQLRELGEMSGGELFELQARDRPNEPRLVSWSPWGHRIDEIELTEVWQRAAKITAEHGLVATAYERKDGALSRVHQFALNHVVQPSLDIYSCPLAMTDGAAKTLTVSGNQALIDRAVPHLTSRDPDQAWTSGQWMTERTGGSDVGRSESVARKDADGNWRLYGTKWFTSATTSQMALTLARPEGNGPGGRGLALFYVELRDRAGSMNHITIHRLKDKFGTRKLPTAELGLEGSLATPVVGLDHGTRHISPMLNVTRTWNAVASVFGMRRAIALVRDYAKRRVAFGASLDQKPLHVDTVAGIAAEYEGAFLLAYRCVELLGKEEAGEASDAERALLRILTPLAKLTTAKQAVHVASETLECFGGAGYVEDTGLPRLLADAQVLPIWEGTTNVLSLDTLRSLMDAEVLPALQAELRSTLEPVRDPGLAAAASAVQAAVTAAQAWMQSAGDQRAVVEAGARRFALTLGRSLELAYLTAHAQWCLDHERGKRAWAAARRMAHAGVNMLGPNEVPLDESALLITEG